MPSQRFRLPRLALLALVLVTWPALTGSRVAVAGPVPAGPVAPRPRLGRVLAGRLGRRGLRLRGCPLPRFDGRDPARQERLLCAPSVAPGYDGRRAKPWDPRVVDPSGGRRYDDMWAAAMAAGADVISVTSWNEWHEGTQIEPARPYCFPDGFCSPGYDGAYGRTGPEAQWAYVDRTAHWAGLFRARAAG